MSADSQLSDARLSKIVTALSLARAAMAEGQPPSILVDLTDEDAALFESSLHSGEFLAFLDRNPQFEALSPPPEDRDLTWEEYAAAGLSVSEFVESFRPQSNPSPSS